MVIGRHTWVYICDWLHRQAKIPLKSGGGAISSPGSGDPQDVIESDSSCTAHLHSLAHWHWALLPPHTLWLWHHYLTLPTVRGVHLVGITGWVGCSTSIQSGKLLCRTSPFSPFSHCTGRMSSSSAGSLTVAIATAGSTVDSSVRAIRVAGSSVGSSVRASSSVDPSVGAGSLVGSFAGAGSLVVGTAGSSPGWVPRFILLGTSPEVLPLQNGMICEGHIRFHHPPQFLNIPP